MGAEIVAMFVYGTLRPHGEHDSSWGYSGQPIIRDAKIKGRMWSNGAYPVVKVGAAAGESSGMVYGDIVFYATDDPQYEQVVAVESGAGYVPEDTIAETEDGTLIPVVVWHYTHSTSRYAPVLSGDWLAETGGGFTGRRVRG